MQLRAFSPEHSHYFVVVITLMWGLCWPEAPTPLTHSWQMKTISEHLRYTAGFYMVMFHILLQFPLEMLKATTSVSFHWDFYVLSAKKERIEFINSAL